MAVICSSSLLLLTFIYWWFWLGGASAWRWNRLQVSRIVMVRISCGLQFDTVVVQVQINNDNHIQKWEIVSINGPFGTKMAALHMKWAEQNPRGWSVGCRMAVSCKHAWVKTKGNTHWWNTDGPPAHSFLYMKDLTDETAFCMATLGTTGWSRVWAGAALWE